MNPWWLNFELDKKNEIHALLYGWKEHLQMSKIVGKWGKYSLVSVKFANFVYIIYCFKNVKKIPAGGHPLLAIPQWNF
jgi:hypothetical protein